MKMKYTLNLKLKYTLSYPRAPAFLAGWVVAVVLVCLVHIAIDITTICTYGCTQLLSKHALRAAARRVCERAYRQPIGNCKAAGYKYKAGRDNS